MGKFTKIGTQVKIGPDPNVSVTAYDLIYEVTSLQPGGINADRGKVIHNPNGWHFDTIVHDFSPKWDTIVSGDNEDLIEILSKVEEDLPPLPI